MKTVIDKIMNAVSKLKGDLDNVATPRHTDKYLYLCNESYFECLSFSDDISWELICTTDEFLATVAECETNFGECEQSYSNYTIDYVLRVRMDRFERMSNLGARLTKKPLFDVPIFTQEMSDNGVLPSVGMEVMIDGEKRVILMGADKDGDYITMSKGVYQFDSIGYIKPLNPPITLIDKGLYLVDIGNKKELVGEAYYTTIGECWMINSLRTNASYRAELCTNIQPLTVEVK
jgi:hypothetical protein